jgi:NAD(P)H-dependent FMN reductase
MVTIISGTNRKGSMTLRVAKAYHKLMSAKTDNVHLLSLEDLNVWERNPQLLKVEQQLLIPSEKFVFVMPEYNGSFPGILKLMIDTVDIRHCWWHKKAALIGLADGRGGNLRGLEHMTNIFHYLKMNVHYNKLPLSRINEEMNEKGEFSNPVTKQTILQQIEDFLKY